MIPRGVRTLASPLEWGTATDTPGSRVRDQLGRALFTGSNVLHAVELRPGEVTALLSEDAVMVLWPREQHAVEVSTQHLVCQDNPHRTSNVL